MIGRLRGKVFQKRVDSVLVDVGGVGYDVQISLTTYNDLPEEGKEATLHIHSHIREDQFSLMGFSTTEEREIFRLLLLVSGIGPRMALNILSGIAPTELVDALKRGLHVRLTAIPGVGKKKAERMVVDLRDKVIDLDLGWSSAEANQADKIKEITEDLKSALLNMGYKAAQVEQISGLLRPEIEDGVSLGELVRVALQKLTRA
ncbi:MAG: Holliday junction branch migration protein RuvA [Myxococcales bacterium]|nr:Holliday junction branch migration protein RuvA [Myxococcales bacterium]MCB9644152.1 Holliday junction branch migration protein RuvA [Myxococcales bacterium]